MKWRVGTKVTRNLYHGDEPIAMLQAPWLAADLAKRLNNEETLSERCEQLEQQNLRLIDHYDALQRLRKVIAQNPACEGVRQYLLGISEVGALPADPAQCPDCPARHAYSDATTPGVFYDKCERHRALERRA